MMISCINIITDYITYGRHTTVMNKRPIVDPTHISHNHL